MDVLFKKTWTWRRKGNLEGEIESLLIAAQNNVIKPNHNTAKVDKMQKKTAYEGYVVIETIPSNT